MIRKVLIIHRTSGVPLLVVNLEQLDSNLDDTLLSGMLKALEGLAEELKIGSFSSFKTTDAIFLVASLSNVLVVLMLEHEDDIEYYKQFAVAIAWDFETSFKLEKWNGNVENFLKFRDRVVSMLGNLSWKEMLGEARRLPEGVAGYVVYDRVNRRFWSNLDADIDVVELINSWEGMSGEVIEANDENLIYVSTKSKHTPFGVIGILRKPLPERDVERYKKLFAFIAENADKTFTLVKETLKAAEKLFGKGAVEEVKKYDGGMLLEVLSLHEDPLTLLDLVRKMCVRGVVSIK